MTGNADVVKHLPDPPKNMSEIAKFEKTFVIVDAKNLTQEESRVVYLKTGRWLVDFSWLLDSVSHYQILDVDKYKVEVVDSVFETQNSLAF